MNGQLIPEQQTKPHIRTCNRKKNFIVKDTCRHLSRVDSTLQHVTHLESVEWRWFGAMMMREMMAVHELLVFRACSDYAASQSATLTDDFSSTQNIYDI